jgi:hypothetical protein
MANEKHGKIAGQWDKKRQAHEEDYFSRKEKEALAALKAKTPHPPRLSPVSGQPMEQIEMDGVTVDRCKESGGLWLDKGEFELLVKQAQAKTEGLSFLDRLSKKLVG